MYINDLDMIASNLIIGFLFMILGFYILLAILEFISSIFNINISIFDSFFGKIFNRKSGEMILQNAVGNIYSVLIEISLWLIPIACAIGAGVLLEGFQWSILGAIAGIILDVIMYGASITLLNIRSSLKKINR